MKCVSTYKTRETAVEARRLLTDKGIASHVYVEGLDGRYSALNDFEDVALCVDDKFFKEASAILSGDQKTMTKRRAA